MRLLALSAVPLAVLAGYAAIPATSLPAVPVAATFTSARVRVHLVPSATIGTPVGARPVASMLQVRGPMRFGDFVWNDTGGSGDVWIRVDLSRQVVSVFRGVDEIGTAVILFGADGRETPRGSFTVLERDRDHRSSTYDAAMPFMLRLTADGVAIHASDVRAGYATHGCIGVPPGFASRLFDVARRGSAVFIV